MKYCEICGSELDVIGGKEVCPQCIDRARQPKEEVKVEKKSTKKKKSK